MMDDTTAPRSVVLTLAALALVGATAVACGDEEGGDGSASDPGSPASTSTSPSASDSPSDTPSSSPTATPSDSGDPVPSPIINKAAKAAIKDDFPALVPAGVPAGWTVTDASYGPKGWRIEMTDPNGAEAGVVQTRGDLAALVEKTLGAGATKSGTEELGEYGTGTWTAYAGGTHAGLAKEIAHTSAVVYAADQDTAVALAELLLTAEDGGSGTGDG